MQDYSNIHEHDNDNASFCRSQKTVYDAADLVKEQHGIMSFNEPDDSGRVLGTAEDPMDIVVSYDGSWLTPITQ